MFQTKVVEKIKRTFYFEYFFRNLAVCEIMWGGVEPEGATVNIMRRNRFACWITKPADT